MNIELTAVFANGTKKNEFLNEIVKWEVRCEIECIDNLNVHYSFEDYTSTMRDHLLRTLDALVEDGILSDYTNYSERSDNAAATNMLPYFSWKAERGTLVTAKHVVGTRDEFICIVDLKNEFCVCRYHSGDASWISGRYHSELYLALKQYNATSAVNVTLAEC